MKKFKMKSQVSSLGSRLMNRTHSEQYNFDTEKRKPPSSMISVKGLKSPQSIKSNKFNDSRDASRNQLITHDSSKALLSEGEPRTLPQAFGKKISCIELNKSQRLTRQSVAHGPLQMYSDVNVNLNHRVSHNYGVKKLQIQLWDKNNPIMMK